MFNDWSHVVILVLCETSPEYDVFFLCCEFTVFLGEGIVAFVVHWVVRFHALFVFSGVFFRDDGFRDTVDVSTKHFKVLVLDDARVGLVMRGVVDDGVSLIVRGILGAGLETDRAPVKFAEFKVEIFIEGARIDELVGYLAPVAFVFGKEVYARAGLDTGEQAVDELIVAADGDALVLVVEIIIVEYKAYRESFDDECRKIFATAAPLLLCVFLDELLEDVLAYERERLFFKIRGLAAVQGGKRLRLLLFDFRLGLFRSQHSPHLVKCIHVEWQIVKFSLVVGNGTVCVAVEFHDGIHEVPHQLVAGMEDVRSVLVDIDAFDVFAIDVSAQLRTFVYDETFPTRLTGAVSECRPEKARTYNEIVVFFHSHYFSLFNLTFIRKML